MTLALPTLTLLTLHPTEPEDEEPLPGGPGEAGVISTAGGGRGLLIKSIGQVQNRLAAGGSLIMYLRRAYCIKSGYLCMEYVAWTILHGGTWATALSIHTYEHASAMLHPVYPSVLLICVLPNTPM
jgi:hypothetical protein